MTGDQNNLIAVAMRFFPPGLGKHCPRHAAPLASDAIRIETTGRRRPAILRERASAEVVTGRVIWA